MRILRSWLNKKGQGIVEYALLLAFVVGIAMVLNGVGLGNAVKDTFDKVAAVLGGEENAYVAGFKKWSSMKKSDLENEDAAARLAADQAALDNIAELFFGKTKSEIETLMGGGAINGKNFYGTINGKNAQNSNDYGDEYGYRDYSTLLLNFKDLNTENDSGINVTYSNTTNEARISPGWLQGTDKDKNASLDQWATKNNNTYSNTDTRYFYSDGMINNAYGSQVRAQFHLGSDNRVDSVRVFAVQNRANTSGRFTQIAGLDRTYDANGAHATVPD